MSFFAPRLVPIVLAGRSGFARLALARSLRRHFLLVPAALPLFLLSTSSLVGAAARRASTRVLRIPVSTRLTHKDPVDLSTFEEWDVFRAVHDKLLTNESSTGRIEGNLLSSWVIDKDTRTLRLRLRDALRFSDGSPLTSADVAYSLKRKIALTSRRSPLLSFCLGLSPEDVERLPDGDVDAIRAPDDATLELHVPGCVRGVLDELAGTNFAIVSRSALGPDLRLRDARVVSGAFRYATDGRLFTLLPNDKNWRYHARAGGGPRVDGRRDAAAGRGPDDTAAPEVPVDFRIEFLPLEAWSEAVKSGREHQDVTVLRSFDPELIRALEKRGYHAAHSLVSASIFLSLRPGAALARDADGVARVLADINARLDRSRLFDDRYNGIYQPSAELFPKDFNCGPSEDGPSSETRAAFLEKAEDGQEVDRSAPPPVSRLPRLVLSSVRNVRFADFEQTATRELRALGYRVEWIRAEDAPRHEADADTIHLQVRAQHLSLRPLEAINFMLHQVESIHDPDDRLKALFMSAAAARDAEAGPETARLCAALHHFNHVPLAQRRTTILARDARFLDLYSRATGNLHLDRALEILAREESRP